MKKIVKAVLLSAMTVFTLSCFAAEHDGHKEKLKEKGVEALSQELRGLLSQEMLALQKGVISLVPEIASGNWHEVETIANKIKASYILKQKLTKEQAKELHSKLPESFVEMDASFHNDAEMLAHAAEKRNSELANFYFYKMNNACTGCHSKYAAHRFPSFKNKNEASHSH